MDRDQRVRVARNYTKCAFILTLSLCRCHHDKVASISRPDHLKEFVLIRHLIMEVTLGRNAHDVISSEARKSSDRASISTKQLCPRLLE